MYAHRADPSPAPPPEYAPRPRPPHGDIAPRRASIARAAPHLEPGYPTQLPTERKVHPGEIRRVDLIPRYRDPVQPGDPQVRPGQERRRSAFEDAYRYASDLPDEALRYPSLEPEGPYPGEVRNDVKPEPTSMYTLSRGAQRDERWRAKMRQEQPTQYFTETEIRARRSHVQAQADLRALERERAQNALRHQAQHAPREPLREYRPPEDERFLAPDGWVGRQPTRIGPIRQPMRHDQPPHDPYFARERPEALALRDHQHGDGYRHMPPQAYDDRRPSMMSNRSDRSSPQARRTSVQIGAPGPYAVPRLPPRLGPGPAGLLPLAHPHGYSPAPHDPREAARLRHEQQAAIDAARARVEAETKAKLAAKAESERNRAGDNDPARRRSVQLQVFVHARPTYCRWENCRAVLNSWSLLEKHLEHAHIIRLPSLEQLRASGRGQFLMECHWTDCTKSFSDRDRLYRHCLMEHMGEFCARCPFNCLFEGPNFPALMAHIGRRHPHATPDDFVPGLIHFAPPPYSPPQLPQQAKIEPLETPATEISTKATKATPSAAALDIGSGMKEPLRAGTLAVAPWNGTISAKLRRSIVRACSSKSAEDSLGKGEKSERKKDALDKMLAGAVIARVIKHITAQNHTRTDTEANAAWRQNLLEEGTEAPVKPVPHAAGAEGLQDEASSTEWGEAPSLDVKALVKQVRLEMKLRHALPKVSGSPESALRSGSRGSRPSSSRTASLERDAGAMDLGVKAQIVRGNKRDVSESGLEDDTERAEVKRKRNNSSSVSEEVDTLRKAAPDKIVASAPIEEGSHDGQTQVTAGQRLEVKLLPEEAEGEEELEAISESESTAATSRSASTSSLESEEHSDTQSEFKITLRIPKRELGGGGEEGQSAEEREEAEKLEKMKLRPRSTKRNGS